VKVEPPPETSWSVNFSVKQSEEKLQSRKLGSKSSFWKTDSHDMCVSDYPFSKRFFFFLYSLSPSWTSETPGDLFRIGFSPLFIAFPLFVCFSSSLKGLVSKSTKTKIRFLSFSLKFSRVSSSLRSCLDSKSVPKHEKIKKVSRSFLFRSFSIVSCLLLFFLPLVFSRLLLKIHVLCRPFRKKEWEIFV